MSIFDLHQQVLGDYRDFVRSFFVGGRHQGPGVRRAGSGRGGPAVARLPAPGQPVLRPRGHGGRSGSAGHVARSCRPGLPHAGRPALPPLSAPGRGDRQGQGRPELRRHQRHRLGQEPDLLPADHRLLAAATGHGRPGGGAGRLSDERPGELAAPGIGDAPRRLPSGARDAPSR